MESVSNRLQRAGICVVIPTYNNAGTLVRILEELEKYTSNLFIVNDGSTDSTSAILKAYAKRKSGIRIISYKRNRGKGYALRQGFREALGQGFKYALTLDSDGQHSAGDIVHFIDAIELHPDTLLVGSRLLKQKNMPRGNTFANRFSNFWFRLQTGINFPDTQSGYRLYPLQKMERMHFYTNRYECELEILVRCAWRGIPIKAIPIEVYYAPEGERVSHFRPFHDFFRISVLNALFTVGAFVYGYPSMWLRKEGKT